MRRSISRRQFLKSTGFGLVGLCLNPLFNNKENKKTVLYLNREKDNLTRANIINVENKYFNNDLNYLNAELNNEENNQYIYYDRCMLLSDTNLKAELEKINIMFNEANLESGYRAIIKKNDYFYCFNIIGYGKHKGFYSITTDSGDLLTEIKKENILIIEPEEKLFLSHELLNEYSIGNQNGICLKLNR